MRQAIQIADETARVTDAAAIDAALAQCAHRLPGAIVEVWQGLGWLVVEQAYDLPDLYTSHLEVFADDPETTIPVRCPEHDLYWLYMLSGPMAIHAADAEKPLVKIDTDRYRVCYLPAGPYACRFGQGVHRFFYVVHKPSALLREESLELAVHDRLIEALKARAKNHANSEAFTMLDGSGEAIRKFLVAPGETYLQRKDALERLAMKLVFIAYASAQAKAGGNRIAAEWADKMTHYIDKCIETGDAVDMHTVAEKFRVSVAYVRVIFDRHVKKPIGQYITSHKLDFSKQLMGNGWTPKQTATYLGWSHSYFCVMFKKEFNITPTYYQKNINA